MFSITINDDLTIGEILFEKTKAMSPKREEFLMEKVIPILQAFGQLIGKSLKSLKKDRAYKMPVSANSDEISGKAGETAPKEDEAMIELRIRLVPLPIVTDTIIHLDSREDMEPAKRFYEELILPSVKTNIGRLEKEIGGMGLGMRVWQIAERRGLDPDKVIRDRELSLQLLNEETLTDEEINNE